MTGVMSFFESCGFVCPVHKDRGSFLQEVTTAVGQQEFATSALRARKGLPDKFDVTLDEVGRTPGTASPASFDCVIWFCERCCYCRLPALRDVDVVHWNSK